VLPGDRLVDQTIESSRKIRVAFERGRAHVDSWVAQHSSLPSAEEFLAWTSQQPASADSVHDIELITDDFPEDAIKQFGQPTSGSYLLCLWRGEWTEYYASWNGKTSLQFDMASYYLLGSAFADFADFAVFAGAGVTSLVLGLCVWKYSPNPALLPTPRV